MEASPYSSWHVRRAASLNECDLLKTYSSPCQNASVDSPHVSVHRSSHLGLRIQSTSCRTLQSGNMKSTLPVFGENDPVEGYVILNPNCSPSGRLLVTLQGVFLYSLSKTHSPESPSVDDTRKGKHVFFSTSTSILISRNSRSTLRGVFIPTARRYNRTSDPSIPPVRRTYHFKFEFPQGSRPGEDLPSTFSSSTSAEATHATAIAEVRYSVTASWTPTDDDSHNTEILEAPILYHPDPDFQSLDGLTVNPEYWLEIPLKADRRIPFQCAITLPTPMVFPRPKCVPYFVVFKTSPRSSSLTQEIASDASICVTLLRHVTVNENKSLPSTPTDTPSSSSDDLRSFSSSRMNFFKRIARSSSPTSTASCTEEVSRCIDREPTPIPPVSKAFSDTCTLSTDMAIGFPKRPRHHCHHAKAHPPLEMYQSLPHGLYKGMFLLNKDMVPSIDWAGLTVKYYLDISIIFRQDELRARIPIRVC